MRKPVAAVSVFLAVASLSLAAPAPAAAQGAADSAEGMPSVQLPPELARVLRDYEERWADGGGEELARLFTPDGFASGEGGWIRGREAVAERFSDTRGPLRLRALAYATDGDVGYVVGAYGYGERAREEDRGRFLLALRRGPDGEWRIAADLDAVND